MHTNFDRCTIEISRKGICKAVCHQSQILATDVPHRVRGWTKGLISIPENVVIFFVMILVWREVTIPHLVVISASLTNQGPQNGRCHVH